MRSILRINNAMTQSNLNKIDKFCSCRSDLSIQTTEPSISSLSDITIESNLTSDSESDFDPKVEFLQYIDPFPKTSPDYDSMNPSRNVRFPIYETKCNSSQPPAYTPAVEGLTLVSMRLEYLEPDHHTRLIKSRIWQNFILELNSSQLNLYRIERILTNHIQKYYDGSNPLSAKRIIPPQTYKFDEKDKTQIMNMINLNRGAFLNSSTLYKSYSLQFADFGIPSDFNKRNGLLREDIDVLRMRCETQQFLLRFINIDELINWSTFLSVGISISLDLDIRELPDYRVFPRRRNRRSRRNSAQSHSSISSSQSSTCSLPSYSSTNDKGEKSSFKKLFSMFDRKHKTMVSSINSDPSTVPLPTTITNNGTISDEHIEDEEHNDEDEMERDDDDDDDCVFDDDNDDQCTLDKKWTPIPKITSREKYISTSIRCIKTFNETHSWLGRIILRESQKLPAYATNNSPIYYINNLSTSAKEKKHLLIKNHFLTAYVLSPSGLVKQGSKVFDMWLKMNK